MIFIDDLVLLYNRVIVHTCARSRMVCIFSNSAIESFKVGIIRDMIMCQYRLTLKNFNKIDVVIISSYFSVNLAMSVHPFAVFYRNYRQRESEVEVKI